MQKFIISEIDLCNVVDGHINNTLVEGETVEDVRLELLTNTYDFPEEEIEYDLTRWKKRNGVLFVDNEESVIIIKPFND